MSAAKPSKQAPAQRPWSVPVAIDDVPETGRRIELAPDPTTRAALAKLARVAGLPRLFAGFDLTRHGRDGLRVVGSVRATVEQACVVTLEAIQSEVEEAIDLLFIPPQGLPAEPGEATVPVDAAEPPEPLQGGVVDLGAVATEFLLLGIDPYPRKPNAVFDAPAASDPTESPFAALAALKKEKNEKDR
jgi:uncharacterized metal-binding protein YceD (DUF177 family)